MRIYATFASYDGGRSEGPRSGAEILGIRPVKETLDRLLPIRLPSFRLRDFEGAHLRRYAPQTHAGRTGASTPLGSRSESCPRPNPHGFAR